MMDLRTCKRELRLAVNSLATALLPHTDRGTDRDTPAGTAAPQVKLRAQVDALCAETVDRILKILELELEKQKNPVQSKEQDTDLGGGGAAGHPELNHVLLHRDAAGERVQELLQANANANTNGEHNVKSSPPLQAQFHDHGYACPSSMLHTAASAAVGGASAARNSRKRRCIWRKDTVDISVVAEEAEPRPQRCLLCRKLFPNSERLSEHHRKWHQACSVCGALFAGILRLREHEFREHGQLPHACDFCPKRFNHKAHRERHVKSHHSVERRWHCDVCGRGCATASTLNAHRKTHFSKTFICDVCGKSFFHSGHLTRHKVLHQEMRPFSCSICGRGFNQAANLRSHQNSHSGERQLCSVCGKSFRCLRKHILSRHGTELPVGGIQKQSPRPSSNQNAMTGHTCGYLETTAADEGQTAPPCFPCSQSRDAGGEDQPERLFDPRRPP